MVTGEGTVPRQGWEEAHSLIRNEFPGMHGILCGSEAVVLQAGPLQLLYRLIETSSEQILPGQRQGFRSALLTPLGMADLPVQEWARLGLRRPSKASENQEEGPQLPRLRSWLFLFRYPK